MTNSYIIFIPLCAALAYFCLLGYLIYQSNQDAKKQKQRELLDKIPCLCGHLYWMHGSSSRNRGQIRCMDFAWDQLCKCTKYRMDNLAYLENLNEPK